ncbi:MAG: MBL fold metallo-hydrolase [Streptococcaceae bacterium]|jgi:glyoxylase-like metal-dependent hydrolase (beta-lactamase superfamily II)|nr:MBL fold metallo-hydrolase [Streptococcaceae bacterium]
MKLAENVVMLDVAVPRGEREMLMHPTLAWDEAHLVLFDTGIPGSGKYFAEAISAVGKRAEDLTDIILTHQDVDHIGGARELLKRAPQAKIYAHEVDTPFIEGTETPTKLAQVLAAGTTGPRLDFLQKGFEASYLPVDVQLKDGELLDFAGGIETIFTPGHTPGHAAFYLKTAKIMVCGDAANVADGVLRGSNPAMTWNMEKAEESLEKIKSYDLAGAICYHSGYLKF